MSWIKMRTSLATHPKVVRIASALKADRLRVIGGLHAVWCLFDAHTEDGILSGYSVSVVDELIGWPGFAAAMVAENWLVESDGALSVRDFESHNGQSAKRRAMEADRKRGARKASAAASASDADNDADIGGTKSGPEKEKEKEKNRGSKNKAPPAGDAELFPDVDPQVVADFKALRKKKRAEVTKTAMDAIASEAAKAGLTLEGALRICCARGWQGFNAEWVERGGDRRTPDGERRLNRQEQMEQNNAAIANRMIEQMGLDKTEETT